MNNERAVNTRFRTAAVATLMALCLTPAPARADDAAAYQKAVGSVVCVICRKPEGGPFSSGTGVVTEGGIVTANHVILPDSLVAVVFPERDAAGNVIGNPTYYADAKHIKLCAVVGTSSTRDLALLRLAEPLKTEPIRMAAAASPGQQIFTIGAGSGALWHYAAGNVRQVYQGGYNANGGVEVRCRIIEMTTPVNPGDSGGPILNSAGTLVGINAATEAGSNQVHKGIDISEVRAFVTEALAAEQRERLKTQK